MSYKKLIDSAQVVNELSSIRRSKTSLKVNGVTFHRDGTYTIGSNCVHRGDVQTIKDLNLDDLREIAACIREALKLAKGK